MHRKGLLALVLLLILLNAAFQASSIWTFVPEATPMPEVNTGASAGCRRVTFENSTNTIVCLYCNGQAVRCHYYWK